MLILKINLRLAIELTKGPNMEELEFNDIQEIEELFRFFPTLKVSNNSVLKNNIPVGKIYEGETADE